MSTCWHVWRWRIAGLAILNCAMASIRISAAYTPLWTTLHRNELPPTLFRSFRRQSSQLEKNSSRSPFRVPHLTRCSASASDAAPVPAEPAPGFLAAKDNQVQAYSLLLAVYTAMVSDEHTNRFTRISWPESHGVIVCAL